MPFSSEHHRDRHAGASAAALELHYSAIPADIARLAGFRRILVQWARGIGMAAELIEDLALATYEAMANVVVHAYRDRPGVFELHATYLAELRQVTVTVTDYGRWQPSRARAGEWESGGRGLPLIRALSTESTITFTGVGTSVRMRWNIH